MRALACLVVLVAGAGAARAELVGIENCGPIARRHDHVEVIGATLRGLGKTPIDRFGVVAFRDGRPTPIPFEIDERRGRRVMVAGPEIDEEDHRPDQFDYDDGVVFMPCDAGQQPSPEARDAYFREAGVTAWREVRVEDTLTGRVGWVYVVVAPAPPATARRYIEYDARDEVRTAAYRMEMASALPARFFLRGMGDRNLLDGLRLRAEVSYLADILGTTITERDARHELLAWHNGPVRTVRRSEHDVHVALGVHLSAGTMSTYFYGLHLGGPGKMGLPISPGTLFGTVSAMAGVDLHGLEGWRFRSAGSGEELAIDGRTGPEEARFDALGPWFLLIGEHEALLTALKLSPNMSKALPLHVVYRDDAAAAVPPENVPGSVPLVGYRADRVETLPAGYYEWEFRVFVLPGYRPGDERRVLEAFATPLHVAVTAPAAPATAPASRP